ncbi:MAG: SMI1/KNR4 family protein [Bacillota bacterium]|uniref:SMI1/KNR4 family protein n=1 Tax=Fictibacillus sp. 18YEL24 TaxID=2745875 RepID=UPI0018CCA967|nr:SMI1/KNR4 family protein [Fictibacillus sp. 18YEL24]MBH0171538.1 SMI1/KNR4 family protein [Fictibacillus sp. 18YEL24]
MTKPSIPNVLNGLKNRLGDRNSLTIQSSGGHLFDMSFTFNPPIDEDVLSTYESLPEDYKNYLRLHNGTKFFSWEYGTLFGIHSLEESLGILEKVKTGEYVPMKYKDDWFPIGYFQDIGGLYIDLSTDKNHLILLGIPVYDLLCDFPTWLDRMIRVNGEIYWEWTSKEL